MIVNVTDVRIPGGSTIGYGDGHELNGNNEETGRTVHFAGDWRPMRNIGEAINGGEYVTTDISDYLILAIEEAGNQ